jgi:hypothetical protein
MQDADGALIQLIEQYDADLLREDRVQMIQEVRDLLSVAKETAAEDAKYELLNRIQGLDNALEGAMNAPDNIMFGLLESAANASQGIVDSIGHMGGYRRLMRKGTLHKRTLRKRKQRRAKRTLRKQRTRK